MQSLKEQFQIALDWVVSPQILYVEAAPPMW